MDHNYNLKIHLQNKIINLLISFQFSYKLLQTFSLIKSCHSFLQQIHKENLK